MNKDTGIELKHTAVMYTDGSAYPNPGNNGGGCHGYVFTSNDFKKNGDKPTGFTVTNQGYLTNKELSEDVAVVKPSYYYNAIYPYTKSGTNNQAELLAINDTIHILTNELLIENIIIYTDSTYSIGVFNKVSKDLKDRKWLDLSRPNMDIANTLADTLLTCSDINIEVRKVKAHGTDVGNNAADRLAYAAREVMANNKISKKVNPIYKLQPGKYWKDKITPNPLLNFKQTYINSGMEPDTNEYIYTIMDYPTDMEIGNKSNEPIFGISVFKNPVEIIDNVTKVYKRAVGSIYDLAAVDLRVLYSQTNYKLYDAIGPAVYNFTKRKAMFLLDVDLLVAPIKPAGLGRAAMNKTLKMYIRYKDHVRTNGADDSVNVSFDITDQLYDVNPKGMLVFKFLQNIVGPKININLDNRDIEIPLVYGRDMLTRNQMKKLETMEPVVSIAISRMNSKIFEYYMIIETNDGSGIYANYYANKIYL